MSVTTDQYGFVHLSSGRAIEAYQGIIGIDGRAVEIYGGYDESFGRAKDLTPEERRELAEYMIGQWKKFGGLD